MRIKNGTLIFVANGAKMRILRNDGGVDDISLTEVLTQEIENPPTRDHGTDSPGRTHSRMGARRSSYSETDWHQQAEDEFAKDAAEALERVAEENAGAEIIVAAAPRALGEMRKYFGAQTKTCLVAEIDKDLTNMELPGIAKLVDAHGES